jgi:hypothetical protein
MIAALAAAALAQQDGCAMIGLSDITAVQAPAVIVLGERHGTQPDLARASKVVKALSAIDHVTLALESVAEGNQPVLDAFAAGQVPEADLAAKLDWENTWGFAWTPYAALVTAASRGVSVVAAGPKLGLPDDPPTFPVPPGYLPLLVDAMQGHDVPPEGQDRFVQAMAYRDWKIADDALNAWDGKGYLVIVAGRGHVEGGKGVQWQAAQRVTVPVEAFVLAWGGDPLCAAPDRVWRVGLFG